VGVVACGGSNGGAGTTYGVPAAVATSPAPLSTVSPAAATTLAEATLLGSPGFIAPTSDHTVYTLSGDSPTNLECTVASGCTGVWGPIAPPAGVALSTGFATFARSDNNAQQLEYMGHPLYTFSGDLSAGTTNGNGLMSYGGTWSVARP
jgi:predicted lipoprotein with Yx(FWY)xxD motif